MEQKIVNYLIGSDPEAFIVDGTGKIVSAIPLVPGDKQDPYPIGDQGIAIQHDNILVEWCLPPVTNATDFTDNVNSAIDWTLCILPEGHEIKFITSFHVEQDQLQDPQAQEFGCTPDYNAWTDSENEKPDAATNLRTAGGHIHIGYDNPSEPVNREIIKALDLFLGVPSLLIDSDTLRRSLYGKAGAFRDKSYGVEYRSLSNFWVNDPGYVEWVFNQIHIAIDFINSGEVLSEEEGMDIQLAINTGDTEIALQLMDYYNMVPVVL